jgi:hypothetical protein
MGVAVIGGHAHGDAGKSDAYADHDARIGGFAERGGTEAESGNECQRSESTHEGAPALARVDLLYTKSNASAQAGLTLSHCEEITATARSPDQAG